MSKRVLVPKLDVNGTPAICRVDETTNATTVTVDATALGRHLRRAGSTSRIEKGIGRLWLQRGDNLQLVRYFYDTEFIEDGNTIELVSIGVVAEDGREFYAVSTEFDPGRAGSWVRANVLDKL